MKGLDFSSFYESHFEEFNQYLRTVISKEKSAHPINTQMALYHYDSGGKRFRPFLVLYLFFLKGKPNVSEAYDLASAVELLHNATLIHDDIQDEDAFRRSMETVWKKFSVAQAINCGNFLFYLSQKKLNSIQLKQKEHIQVLFLETALELIEGQAEELNLKKEPVISFETYFSFVQKKTSALFFLPIASAVHGLGLHDEIDLGELKKSSADLGILFQMIDDYIDVFGKKGREKRGSDLAEGKMSFLACLLLKKASAKDQQLFLNILHKPRSQTTSEDIENGINLYLKYSVAQEALYLIHEAQRSISFNPLDDFFKAIMEWLMAVVKE